MLGKYRLGACLGQGGMGVVYEATDTLLKRRVAVKLLHEARPADGATQERFLREARAAARLNHPHVIAVHDVGRAADVLYLVMELVPGGSAQDRLRAGNALNWRQATRMIADACCGLGAAHAAGLIHRDIKPSNLLCGPGDMVKVADFGLAKLANHADKTLTTAGNILGTPHYMSPEQCRGEQLDPRSDLYSLGATYYALLTGKPPYEAENPMGIQFAHCGSPIPDPRASDPAIPEACTEIIRRAMAKEPSQRFATAAEMLAALEAVLADARPAAARALDKTEILGRARRRRSRLPWAIAASFLAMALAGLGIWRPWSSDSRGAQQAGQPQPELGPVAKAVPPVPARPLQVAFVLASKDFWKPDFDPVQEVLEDAGVKVVVASSKLGAAQPQGWMKGQVVKVDVLLREVKADEVDAVIFGGGLGYTEFTEGKLAAKDAQRLIEAMRQRKKPVAALCAGPLILADAGALNTEKKATGYAKGDGIPVKMLLEKAGIKFVDAPWVWSDGILTGRNPEDAREFTRELLAALKAGQAPPDAQAATGKNAKDQK